jgi:hypothetical protein
LLAALLLVDNALSDHATLSGPALSRSIDETDALRGYRHAITAQTRPDRVDTQTERVVVIQTNDLLLHLLYMLALKAT